MVAKPSGHCGFSFGRTHGGRGDRNGHHGDATRVHDEVDITSGRCQLLFRSPESWLLNKKWRDMLGSDVFQANVMGIVGDEVHLTYKW